MRSTDHNKYSPFHWVTRETVMTAQSIGQVVERSIEVNEEPGSLVNVLNLNILVFNYQT